MRNFYAFLLLLLCAGVITSCQKEITGTVINNPNTGNGNSGGSTGNGGNASGLIRKLLIKATNNSDSSATSYFYDSNSRLISTMLVGFNFGSATNLFTGFERNSAGLIVRRKSFDRLSANPLASDTAVTNYFYTTGSSPKLTYSVAIQNFMGITSTDSTVYTYNSGGYITKTESYVGGMFSPVPTLSSRFVYTYDASGNCTKIETYNVAGGVATLGSTITIAYDTKNPPMVISNEEAAIISITPSLKHNGTNTSVNSSVAGVTQNTLVTDNYTYNSSNRPSGGTRVQTSTGFGTVNSTMTITYQ